MRINRRQFLTKFALGASTFVASCSFDGITNWGSRKRLNILWIFAEDVCPDMACYGVKNVKTPNVDKLAAEGAIYTNAFTTASVCSPSRSAIMTGMYQTTIGAHHQRSNVARKGGEQFKNKPLPDGVKLITEYFRDAGYFVCNRGHTSWEKKGKTDFNFTVDKYPFNGTDWRQRKPEQPFFAQVNLHQAHRPYERDAENPVAPDKVKLPPYYPDYPLARRDWADYLETIQLMDKEVGKVMRRLEDDGLFDSTIVIFLGDHGRDHARGKQFLYDEGIHIPLIIRWPGHIRPGTVVNDLVSAIDLGPTCMDLAGIKLPANFQGRPFLGPHAKKREMIFAARDRVDGVYERIRCVRTKRYKYIRNFFPDRPYNILDKWTYNRVYLPVLTLMQVLNEEGKLTKPQADFMAVTKPVEELYDLKNDPDEIHNLANEPEYQNKLEYFRKTLNDWIIKTDDKGRFPEVPEETAKAVAYHKERNEEQIKKRGLPLDITPPQYLEYWEKELFKNSSADK